MEIVQKFLLDDINAFIVKRNGLISADKKANLNNGGLWMHLLIFDW